MTEELNDLFTDTGGIQATAAKLAEDAGLKVVMNRCPKIELFRPFWKPRLDLAQRRRIGGVQAQGGQKMLFGGGVLLLTQPSQSFAMV